MNFISFCSGIEAASVAFAPLGWKAVAFSEIEPFPCAVLAHHYPDVPNLGDMTNFREWPEEIFASADAIVGGPPCQAFSLAGLRNGLNDSRGNLTLTYAEIINHADAIRIRHGKPPVVVIYENVLGLLSDKTGAFGCLLAALAGEDGELQPPGKKWTNAGCVYGPQRTLAWGVTDAQFFGVAQRRRRVFVVASAREGFDPAWVLFEPESVRRDSPPSREAGEETAAGTLRSTDGGSDVDHGCAGHLVPITMAHGQGGAEIGFDRAPTLTCNHEAPIAAYQAPVAGTLTAHHGNIKADHAWTGQLVVTKGDVDCIAFPEFLSGTQQATSVDLSPSLGSLNPMAVAIGWSEELTASVEMAGTLQRGGNGGRNDGVLTPSMQVRRLLPVECERLQGFPDNYSKVATTVVTHRKSCADHGTKEVVKAGTIRLDCGCKAKHTPAERCPDGPRYKALGNSWAVPNVQWIGKRIDSAIRGVAQ